MGYARSLVSRLRHYSEERGRLKLKIQELTGKDMGKVYVLWADKMGLTRQQAEEVFKDFKTMGFTVVEKSGESSNEDGRMAADMLDFSLQPTITAYVDLWKQEGMEMEAMASTSNVALGQQTTVIGKGVQENTINQSTLGQISLYDGLMEHWRQVLQYALNVEKTLKAGKEEIVQTSPEQSYLINIDKALRFEDVGLFIQMNDPFEQDEKDILQKGLFAYAQNGGTLESAEALLNVVKIIRAKSSAEQEKHLERFIEKKAKQQAMVAQQESVSAQELQNSGIALQKVFEAQMQESKDLNANYRVEVQSVMSAVAKMSGDLEKTNQLILQLSQSQPQTPAGAIVQQAEAQQSEQQAQV